MTSRWRVGLTVLGLTGTGATARNLEALALAETAEFALESPRDFGAEGRDGFEVVERENHEEEDEGFDGLTALGFDAVVPPEKLEEPPDGRDGDDGRELLKDDRLLLLPLKLRPPLKLPPPRDRASPMVANRTNAAMRTKRLILRMFSPVPVGHFDCFFQNATAHSGAEVVDVKKTYLEYSSLARVIRRFKSNPERAAIPTTAKSIKFSFFRLMITHRGIEVN